MSITHCLKYSLMLPYRFANNVHMIHVSRRKLHSSDSIVNSDKVQRWRTTFRRIKSMPCDRRFAMLRSIESREFDTLKHTARMEGLELVKLISSDNGLHLIVLPGEWDEHGFWKQSLSDGCFNKLRRYFSNICKRKMKLHGETEEKLYEMQTSCVNPPTYLLGQDAPYVSWYDYKTYFSKQEITNQNSQKLLHGMCVTYGQSPYDLWESEGEISFKKKMKTGLRLAADGFWMHHPNKDIRKRVMHVIMEMLEQTSRNYIPWNSESSRDFNYAKLISSHSMRELEHLFGKKRIRTKDLKSIVVQYTQRYPEGRFGWDAFGVYSNRPKEEYCLKALGLLHPEKTNLLNQNVFPGFLAHDWNIEMQNTLLVKILNCQLWNSHRGQRRGPSPTITYVELAININTLVKQLYSNEVLENSSEKKLHDASLNLKCTCMPLVEDSSGNTLCRICHEIRERLLLIPFHRTCHLEFSCAGIYYRLYKKCSHADRIVASSSKVCEKEKAANGFFQTTDISDNTGSSVARKAPELSPKSPSEEIKTGNTVFPLCREQTVGEERKKIMKTSLTRCNQKAETDECDYQNMPHLKETTPTVENEGRSSTMFLSAHIEQATLTGTVDFSVQNNKQISAVFDAVCLHILKVMARVNSSTHKLKSSIEKRMNKEELSTYWSLLRQFSTMSRRSVNSLVELFENTMPASQRESAALFCSLVPSMQLSSLGKSRYDFQQKTFSKKQNAIISTNLCPYLHRSFQSSTLRLHKENIQKQLDLLRSRIGNVGSYRSNQNTTSFSPDMPVIKPFQTDLRGVGQRRSEPVSYATFFNNLLVLHQYENIRSQIKANRVTIIKASTGSGKSTGVPLIILDDISRNIEGEGRGRIICVQPRRLAATSIASYIKEVRREETGDEDVGSIVRFDTNVRFDTDVLIYMTTGIFLRMLIGAERDSFDNVSHIIIDEIHERSLEIDIILLLIREKIITSARTPQAKDFPRVILMSATFDTEKFEKYFNDSDIKIASLLIEGERRYPVTIIPLENVLKLTSHITSNFLGFEHRNFGIIDKPYKSIKSSKRRALEAQAREAKGFQCPDIPSLCRSYGLSVSVARELYEFHYRALSNDFELDYRLILKTIISIHYENSGDNGTILVFLPTMAAIKIIEAALVLLRLQSAFKIIKLHSKLERSSREIYEQAPLGKRKVILSTNIAQTSLTIPDVVYVVDSGVHHQRITDKESSIPYRCDGRISRACATQRAGRSGRVSPGTVYQLISSWEKENLMDDFLLPEIQRTSIEHICLLMVCGGWVQSPQCLLQRAIDPPPAKSVEKALIMLGDLRAIEALPDSTAFRSTNVGHMMVKFDIDPKCAKMLVLARAFGILPIALNTVPLLEVDSVQSYTTDVEKRSDQLRKACVNSKNDFLALFAMLESATTSDDPVGQWCEEHNVQFQEMENAIANKKRLVEIGKKIDGEGVDEAHNISYRNSKNLPLVYYAILSGSFESTAVDANIVKKGGGIIARIDGQEYKVSIATPSAVSDSDINKNVRSKLSVVPVIYMKCFKRKNLSRKIQIVCMGDLLAHIMMSPNVDICTNKQEISFNDGLVVMKCIDQNQANELQELRTLIQNYVEMSTGIHQFRFRQAREAILKLIEDTTIIRSTHEGQESVFKLKNLHDIQQPAYNCKQMSGRAENLINSWE